ncbi:hypothetical protein ACFLV3_03060 [Chloroflexota bacterium]
MILSKLSRRYISFVIVIVLFGVLACTATGCTDFEQWAPPTQTPEAQTEEEAPPPATVKTEEKAILAVYEHLLSQAEGHEAKAYLADFYAVCDEWSAEPELFKDGTRIWHVVVDMTDVEVWEEQPHWQQASWFILQDSMVIPSNRFQANALRIEADLQELSLPTQQDGSEKGD